MRLENLYVVLLHGIENILLICPLLYLYNAASTRHKLLEDTVGAVPLEIEAMNRIFWLLIIAVLLITLSSPLQVTLLYAFNKYGHPWKRFFNEFCFDFSAVIEREHVQGVQRTHFEVRHFMENFLISIRHQLLFETNLIRIVFLTKLCSVTLISYCTHSPICPVTKPTLGH